MVFIKVKKGCIQLNKPIHNDDGEHFLGLYSIALKGNNFINIESDCCIKIKQKIIQIKTGRYSIEQLNKKIEPVIISFSSETNKITIKSPCYYNLDEKLKKYLGFENSEFDFSIVSSKPIIYHPNSNENYINIEQDCRFKIGRDGEIPMDIIFKGIYTIQEIENLLNVYDFPKIRLELIDGFIKISASVGLCFDEYLSKCLGIDYIGDFITEAHPINKIWPASYEVAPDIDYIIIGTNKVMIYTQGFIKNIKGIISNENSEIELKGNYSIEHLNSLFNSIMKLENNDNYIKITTKDYFSFDQDLNLSLGGIDTIYTHYGENSSLNNNNKILEVHCNIIEESITHDIDEVSHYDEVLFLFQYNSNKTLNQPFKIIYRPVSKNRFQEIKIYILDLKGNIVNFDEEFIGVLDLIKK